MASGTRAERRRVAPRVLAGGLALLALVAAARAEGPPPLSVEQARAIETAISAEMARLDIPAVSVAVATREGLRLSAAYGVADLENGVPARPATIFRLASLSKVITAVAVMQLAERGELDLDAPIQKYVPSFPEKPWPVTVRQLLAHQGGIRHYAEGEMQSARHFGSLPEALEMFKDSPLLHEPGTKARYSSYGYNLLGCAVEGASNMSFMEYVRRNIFIPADMTHTQADDHFEIVPNRARGYFKDATGKLRNSPLSDTSNKIPAGGLCGTAADMGRFAVAFLEGHLVKPETVQRMLTRQKTRDGKLTGFGLGLVVAQREGQREAFCTGAQPQVSGTLYLHPDSAVAVVLLANLESIPNPLNDLARRIAAALPREGERGATSGSGQKRRP